MSQAEEPMEAADAGDNSVRINLLNGRLFFCNFLVDTIDLFVMITEWLFK